MIFKGLAIGIPREVMENENRVAATPETVKKMVDQGASVLVEKNAGTGSFFNDRDYDQAGATIIETADRLFEQSDIILKVKEPQFNRDLNRHETTMLKKGQILICFLHPAAPQNREMISALTGSGATCYTLDGIPRITRAQSMDALTSMSSVAGYKGVIMAANTLARFIPMVSTAAGTIKPSTVLVIGAGVAGLQSLATAKRLGAVVSAADIRPDAAEQAKSLGAAIIDTGISPDKAVGKGGYAQQLSSEMIAAERKKLAQPIAQSDIVILSALVPGREAPILVTEDMVRSMKPGSVIVDISVDQGGNCEITRGGVTHVKHGVTIFGIKNIPGSMPSSSTLLFAGNIFNFVSYLYNSGALAKKTSDEIAGPALVAVDGTLVHQGALEAQKSAGRRSA